MTGLRLDGSFSVYFDRGRDFWSWGLTISVLKSGGKKTEANEMLMMLVIVGRRKSRFSYSSSVGMGSRSHDLGTVFWRISETNCSMTGVNVCSNFPE